jgi:membrane-bound metal-dependent hydrolase YbcI (DUF457 family)
VLAAALIVSADAVIPGLGESIWLLGALDELAHMATGVVTLGTLGPVVDGRLARGLMGASVLLDVDHVPQYAGADWLTAGTARPYPHSLLTLIAASGTFLLLRRKAPQAGATMTAQGLVIGLGAHVVRDLAEPDIGMPLLWPIDNRAFSIPRRLYRATLAVGVGRRLTAVKPETTRRLYGQVRRGRLRSRPGA